MYEDNVVHINEYRDDPVHCIASNGDFHVYHVPGEIVPYIILPDHRVTAFSQLTALEQQSLLTQIYNLTHDNWQDLPLVTETAASISVPNQLSTLGLIPERPDILDRFLRASGCLWQTINPVAPWLEIDKTLPYYMIGDFDRAYVHYPQTYDVDFTAMTFDRLLAEDWRARYQAG